MLKPCRRFSCERSWLALLFSLLAPQLFPLTVAGTLPVPKTGWRIELIAEAPKIRHPSVVCTAPDGRLFVAEDPMDISTDRADVREGRILCLFPDGRATLFADKLHAVFGLQYLEGKLYALHNPKFTVFTDDPITGIARDRHDLIEQTTPKPWALDWNDHIPANFRIAMDGFFYFSVGDKGIFGMKDRRGNAIEMHGGGIIRMRPDGTDLEVYSRGVRNIMDVAVDSEDELFTYDNTDEHQWMGRLTHMVDGGFYGYPHDFIPRRPYTLWMLADYGPGAATAAVAWNDASLPPDYQRNLVLADWGQRNLRRVRLEPDGATFRDAGNEVIFSDPPPDFRPVGIHETPDQRGFYICDWQHVDNKEKVTVGRLWKLTATHLPPAPPLPENWVALASGSGGSDDVSQLLSLLAHPHKTVRLAAQRTLSKKGAVARESLIATLRTHTNAAARMHALWALDGIESSSSLREATLELASSGTAQIPDSLRIQILRYFATRRVGDSRQVLEKHLDHPNARVRFHAVSGLRRLNSPASLPALEARLAEPDFFTRHAVVGAIQTLASNQPQAWDRLVARCVDPSERTRESARHVLRDTWDPALADIAIRTVSTPSQRTELRRVIMEWLGTVHHRPPAWDGSWWAYHPANTAPPERTVAWSHTDAILAAIRGFADDSDLSLRRAALAGLRTARDGDSKGVIRSRASEESDSVLRAEFISTLRDDPAPESGRLLLSVISGNSPAGCRKAAWIAASEWILRNGDSQPSIADSLLEQARMQLSDPAGDFQMEAVAALGGMRRVEARALLIPVIHREDPLIRAEALKALQKHGASNAAPTLMRLVASTSTAVRIDAIAALGKLGLPQSIPILLAAHSRPETKSAALLALCDTPDLKALDVYLEGLGSKDASVRDRCRRAVARTGPGVRAALEARSGKLSGPVLAELRRAFEREANILDSPLFASVPKPPSAEEYASHATANPGDPWVGQRFFIDPAGPGCNRCHAVAGHGGSIGPELTTIGSQSPRVQLIESILFPSRTVREGYQQYSLSLDDGEILLGMVRAETATSIILIDAAGETNVVAKKQVVRREATSQSLMPEGLHGTLSLDEFTDLIAYLESLREDPRRIPARSIPANPSTDAALRVKDWKASGDWIQQEGIWGSHGKSGSLACEQPLGDFDLRIVWRWTAEPRISKQPVRTPSGSMSKDSAGAPVTEPVVDAGNALLTLRGSSAAGIHLSPAPEGSGALTSARESAPDDILRKAWSPQQRSDRPAGQWNILELSVTGERCTLRQNGLLVLDSAALPEVPPQGPLELRLIDGAMEIRELDLRTRAQPTRP